LIVDNVIIFSNILILIISSYLMTIHNNEIFSLFLLLKIKIPFINWIINGDSFYFCYDNLSIDSSKSLHFSIAHNYSTASLLSLPTI